MRVLISHTKGIVKGQRQRTVRSKKGFHYSTYGKPMSDMIQLIDCSRSPGNRIRRFDGREYTVTENGNLVRS